MKKSQRKQRRVPLVPPPPCKEGVGGEQVTEQVVRLFRDTLGNKSEQVGTSQPTVVFGGLNTTGNHPSTDMAGRTLS